MISSAFKSAYRNEVSAQAQGINTISTGVKSAATAIAGGLAFGGALGTGAVAKAAKFGLANQVGGVGGSIMLASMESKTMSNQAGILASDQESLESAFDKMAYEYKDAEDIAQLSTVWETITRAREKSKQQEMIKKVEQNLKEE